MLPKCSLSLSRLRLGQHLSRLCLDGVSLRLGLLGDERLLLLLRRSRRQGHRGPWARPHLGGPASTAYAGC